MSQVPPFSDFFQALWNKDPFPWQTMLADRVREGIWPDALDLPTASGKTACLDIAVWALAAQAEKPPGQRAAASGSSWTAALWWTRPSSAPDS